MRECGVESVPHAARGGLKGVELAFLNSHKFSYLSCSGTRKSSVLIRLEPDQTPQWRGACYAY